MDTGNCLSEFFPYYSEKTFYVDLFGRRNRTIIEILQKEIHILSESYQVKCIGNTAEIREAKKIFKDANLTYYNTLNKEEFDSLEHMFFDGSPLVLLVLGRTVIKEDSRMWQCRMMSCYPNVMVISVVDILCIYGLDVGTFDFGNRRKNMVKRLLTIISNKWMSRVYSRDTEWYKKIFVFRNLWERMSGINEEYSQKYLEILIAQYIEIRDFKWGLYYIEEYVKRQYDEYEKFILYGEQIKRMLEEISENVKESMQNNIFLHWIDTVSRDKFDEWGGWECKEEDSGLFFENVYSFAPWTQWTMRSMFTNEKIIEGKLFQKKALNSQEYRVLSALENRGMLFQYIVAQKNKEKYVDKKHVVSISNAGNLEPVTRILWTALAHILKNPLDQHFYLLHYLTEVHSPFLSGQMTVLFDYSTTSMEMVLKMREESYMYLRDEIQWYQEKFGNGLVDIYMSDHGGNENPVSFVTEEKLHTFLFVQGNQIENKKITSLFSLLDFSELLDYIFEPTKDNLNRLESHKYIFHENYDFYHSGLVREVLDRENIMDSYEEWMQYRGVRNKDYKMFLFADGQLHLYRVPDIEVDIEDNKEIVDELQKFLGTQFIDVFQEDYFIQSRKLYQEMGDKGNDKIK